MRLYIKFILFISILLIRIPSGLSQESRYTEAKIGIEHIFIAANKEKLIGNYDKAIELYEEVYKKDRNNAAVCYELARSYDHIGENERAVEYSEKSIKLDPTNEWYFIFNAEILEKSTKSKEAAGRYKALVKKDPDNKYYYIKWAFNELESGNAKEAINAFNTLEKKAGISEDITHRKFNIYVSLGKNKEAANELIALCKSSPRNTRFLNNLAGFYMNIGKNKDANKVYKKILEIDPEDASANIALAGNSHSNRKEVSYLKAIKPVLNDPQVSLYVKLKELIPFVEKVTDESGDGLTVELIKIAVELVNIHPNDARVYSIYGDILFNSGNLEEAEKQYLKTLELNKKVYAVWEQLMYTQSELEKFEGLLNTASKAMDIYPNQASAYYFNALAHFRNNNLTDASDLLNESIMISGKNTSLKARAYVLFAEIEYSAKDFSKAEEYGQLAINIGSTNDPKLLEVLGDISFHKDNIDKAVEYWQKALEAGSKSEKLNLKIQQRQIIE